MRKTIHMILLSTLLMGVLSACSTTQKTTSSARTATEQLLLSQAIARSLPEQSVPPLSFVPKEAIIKLDVTGLTTDKDMAKGVVAAWLGSLGYVVQDGAEKATHRINVVIDSLGSEMGNTFFGIPPIHSTFIPISLPELAFFKADSQVGYVKFHLDVSEMSSGRFIASSAPFIADTYYTAYTVLFLISFYKTDLDSPPKVKVFSR